jgi:hypothetical protein
MVRKTGAAQCPCIVGAAVAAAAAARPGTARAGIARRLRARIGALTHTGTALMDTEHINAIGNALADLTRRTQDLRGYL